MRKLILFFALLSTLNLVAQSTKSEINYSLKRTFTVSSGATVGGDLVVPGDPVKCKPASTNFQQIFSGTQLNSAVVNVKNVSGNSCVTLTVVTTSTTHKIIVPAGSQSGLLRFARVTSVSVSIENPNEGALPQTNSADGTVEFWF